MKLLSFFKKILFAFFIGILFLLSLYFFVFPSMLQSNIGEQNLLIVSKKLDSNSSHIYFAHISDNNGNNLLFEIQAEQSIEVPRGYGEYPLQSVYQLLKIDKKDSQFVTSVFSELLELSVDEVVVVNSELSEVSQSQISKLFLISAFKNLQELDLNSASKTLLLHYKSKHMDVVTLDSTEGIQSYYEDIPSIYGDLSQYCSVAVVNGTDQNGLAGKIGKIIENTGGLVVRLDDVETRYEKTKIYFGTDPVDCSRLAHSISGIFVQNPEIISINELENAQQYRANIVVIVGE